jgi:uncharacterized damage-inducible protein DinB
MNELDFAKGEYKAYRPKTPEELMDLFQERLHEVIETLQNTSDEKMQENFTLRSGGHIIASLPRMIAIRSMALSHIVHHRGQLSVYLRLLDIPVPGMYGPSADEM